MSSVVYIDFPNIFLGLKFNYLNPPSIEQIADSIKSCTSRDGQVPIYRVYGDWSDQRYETANRVFTQKGFDTKQVARKNNGKDRTDLTLSLDLLELFYTSNHIDCLYLGSGDSDYVDVVRRIRQLKGDKITLIAYCVEKTASSELCSYLNEAIYAETYFSEKGHNLIFARPIISLLLNMHEYCQNNGLFLGFTKFKKSLDKLVKEENLPFNSQCILNMMTSSELIFRESVNNPKNPSFPTSAIKINESHPIIKDFRKKFKKPLTH